MYHHPSLRGKSIDDDREEDLAFPPAIPTSESNPRIMAEALSGLTGALQGSISGMINKGQGILDRFFPPERRNELSAKLSKFATEKPMFAVG